MKLNTSTEKQVIHEAVDERQFVRIELPVKVHIELPGHSFSTVTKEISLGGFSFESDTEHFTAGLTARALIEIPVGSVGVHIHSDIKVLNNFENRVSVKFESLNFEERDVLRYIIGAYLSGEIVNVNGIFNVLARENYVKQRKTPGIQPRSTSGRLKAILGTATYCLGALMVAGILGYRIYSHFFTVAASHAYVDIDGYDLRMPENGYLSFIIDESTTRVNKGEAIATIATQLKSDIGTVDDLSVVGDLSKEDIDILLGRTTVETAISSPCDCTIHWLSSSDSRYAYKDEPLIKLVDNATHMVVRASFQYADAQRIDRTDVADVKFLSGDEKYTLSVLDYQLDIENSLINIGLQLPKQPQFEQLGLPVKVKLRPDFGGLLPAQDAH